MKVFVHKVVDGKYIEYRVVQQTGKRLGIVTRCPGTRRKWEAMSGRFGYQNTPKFSSRRAALAAVMQEA